MELSANVDIEEALTLLGHAGQTLDDDLRIRLERAARICERDMTPRGMARAFKIEGVEWSRGECGEETPAIALMGTSLRLRGCDIARHLEGCDTVVLMAVTLGAQSEMVLRREAACSSTDGLLVDACASSLAEQAANALNRIIADEAETHGATLTWRYSPGYGDLPLSCQRDFLTALGADRALGIRATESFLLVPAKSITAIIGVTCAGSAREEQANLMREAVGEGCANEGSCGDAHEVASTPDASASAAPTPKVTKPSRLRFGRRSKSATPCDTCAIASTCTLRAKGKTCYGASA